MSAGRYDSTAPEALGPTAGIVRCRWAGNEVNIPYHDQEWGVPVHDDSVWFEFLTLEGAQAGLSWDTVLRKRERYRQLFAGFEPAKVARFRLGQIEKLMADPGIIRNRLKIQSTISNAKSFLEVQDEFGSFDKYIWGFVENSPIQNRRKERERLPAETPLAVTISKDLKKRGFRFVGATICYALMQATGLVNDHAVTCFRHPQLAGKASKR